MRTRIAFAALALLAVATSAQAETKILVVRSADVVRDSVQFKAAEAKMKAEFEKRRADIEAQGKAFGDDVKAYQRDADTMSADQRAKKEKDLNARQVDLNFAQRKFQEDLQNRDRELTQDMMAKIKDVIAQVAKEKGADLIVQDPVFASPAVDVTADVLKRLNAGAGK
ncbi:MAG: OmpH family outer membrane protein [Nevskiaceae bacterium]|jgi:outer membrane protein|nr:MAG: OmpH family outer membrane protein [Nevskiaceae bacterium]TAM27165.1 MAG: OmpH family outer membrane protein [Nevskiaceae bacterium]